MKIWLDGHLLEAMNAAGKSLHGARVLMLGLAYKPGISDDRESPAYAMMELLGRKGANVEYHDGHIPTIPPGHGVWSGRTSTSLGDRALSAFDAAVVCTAHPDVDYASIADLVPLVVDACHVVPKDRKARVVAA